MTENSNRGLYDFDTCLQRCMWPCAMEPYDILVCVCVLLFTSIISLTFVFCLLFRLTGFPFHKVTAERKQERVDGDPCEQYPEIQSNPGM